MVAGTFKHTHTNREDPQISLLNTQILKKNRKKTNNTQIKIYKFVCLKVN